MDTNSQIDTETSFRRRLVALSTLSGLLAQSLRPRDVLPTATEMVANVMDVEIVLIYSMWVEESELVLSAYRGVSGKFARGVDRMKVGEGFNGRVAETGEPLIVSDAAQDPRLSREIVREEKIKAQLIVPMKSGGEVVGTICVATRREREFDDDEVEVLTAIANQTGIALDKADLFQSQQSMTERLQRSEANYRELFENASDAILIHDLEGRIIEVNKACEKLLGHTENELLGRKASEFLKQDFLGLAQEVRNRLLGGETMDQRYEQVVERGDGSEAIVEIATRLIYSDGKPVGYHNIGRDITDERKMRDNLRYYLRQVLRAQEEERKRIARELHDDTSQSLLLLIHRLDALMSNPGARLSRLATEDVTKLYRLSVDTLEGVRRYAQELRPSILDDLGLVAAVKWVADNVSRERDIAINVEVSGSEYELSPEERLVLFRIAQEALTNIKRHSEASEASVTLDCGTEQTTLMVSDNGKGFEPPQMLGDLTRIGGLGLTGMRERARLLGGTLNVESKPGEGTKITAELPRTGN